MALLASGDAAAMRSGLEDADPKMRGLAVLAIGLGDDPSMLSLLEPRLNDHAPTFHATMGSCGPLVEIDGKLVPAHPARQEPQDVARLAAQMFREWTGLGSDEGDRERIHAYLKAVPDPERSVHAWICRLHRAQFRHRRDADRQRREIRYVQDRLARQEPPWLQAVVALSVERINFDYWEEADRIALVRPLISREFATACLKGEPPFHDPYLTPAPNHYPYKLFCRRLLLSMAWKPEDREILLKIEAEQTARRQDLRMAEWVIAASRADPRQAASLLKDAIGRMTWDHWGFERVATAIELWNTAGPQETDYLCERFHQEAVPDSESRSTYQDMFLSELFKSAPGCKTLLGKILKDPRGKKLPHKIVKVLIAGCNQLAGEEIVPERMTRNLWGFAEAIERLAEYAERKNW